MAIKTPVDTRLAIEGGTPVRSADDPLPGIFPRDVPQESYDNIREVLEKGLTSGYLRRFGQEFAEVNGVGKVKLERFAAPFLEIITNSAVAPVGDDERMID